MNELTEACTHVWRIKKRSEIWVVEEARSGVDAGLRLNGVPGRSGNGRGYSPDTVPRLDRRIYAKLVRPEGAREPIGVGDAVMDKQLEIGRETALAFRRPISSCFSYSWNSS